MADFRLIDPKHLALLKTATDRLGAGYAHLPETSDALEELPEMEAVLATVANRMHDNYPYAHPLYAGQMLKPPHPIARAAYQMAMWVNPNNHALDGGRASSALEKEAVEQIASMLGHERYLGHLTSSGTLANLEALWIAGEEHPGKLIAASTDAHYTHQRLSAVLKLPFQGLTHDRQGRLRIDAVESLAQSGELGTIVVTAGTTSFGAVDPVAEIIELSRQYQFRVHVDAAYGGYFTLAALPTDLRRHFDAISQADSIAIDPHKHGLQPYGCGCVIHSDPKVGRHYKHDSPYTYFSSDELHLGEISIECSRAGAAATALWATQQYLPLARDGTFANRLSDSLQAARSFADLLAGDTRYSVLQEPELDIVVWAVQADSLSAASTLAKAVFEECAKHDLHLALIDVAASRLDQRFAHMIQDSDSLTCLRSCLMKPEHLAWVPRIFELLASATEQCLTDQL